MFEQLKSLVLAVFASPDCPPDSQPVSQILHVRDQLTHSLKEAKSLVEARNEGKLDEFLQSLCK